MIERRNGHDVQSRAAVRAARRVRLVCLSLAAASLGVLPAPAARAELPPLAEVGVQYLPSSRVPEAGGLGAQVSSYDALFNVPLALGESTFFVPGVQYHVDSVSYSDEPPGFTPLDALHALDLTLLLAQRLNDAWTLSFRVWPGVAGDFEAIDASGLHVGALGMLTGSPGERFTLGGGVLASYAFGQLLPLPILYVDWAPLTVLRVEASLPFFASGVFSFADRVELGLLADVGGNEYSIRKPEIRERYPCVGGTDDPATPADESRAEPASCTDHLAYSVVAAGAVARVRLFSSLWLGTFFGHTLYRRYELKNADGESVPGGEADLPNELVFRLALSFRIPAPEATQPAAKAR
jgi:hypothetical protein